MTAVAAKNFVQSAAKRVLDQLVEDINQTLTGALIALTIAHYMATMGYPHTWYHRCPGIVLLDSGSLCRYPAGNTALLKNSHGN